jgi:hypothetical protein
MERWVKPQLGHVEKRPAKVAIAKPVKAKAANGARRRKVG